MQILAPDWCGSRARRAWNALVSFLVFVFVSGRLGFHHALVGAVKEVGEVGVHLFRSFLQARIGALERQPEGA